MKKFSELKKKKVKRINEDNLPSNYKELSKEYNFKSIVQAVQIKVYNFKEENLIKEIVSLKESARR